MFFYNFFYSVPDLKPNERMHRIETGGRFDYNDVARPSLPRSSVLVGQCAPQCIPRKPSHRVSKSTDPSKRMSVWRGGQCFLSPTAAEEASIHSHLIPRAKAGLPDTNRHFHSTCKHTHTTSLSLFELRNDTIKLF